MGAGLPGAIASPSTSKAIKVATRLIRFAAASGPVIPNTQKATTIASGITSSMVAATITGILLPKEPVTMLTATD